MSTQAIHPPRSWPAGFAYVVIGILVAIAVVVALTLVRPVVFAFALGGLLLLTPTLLMREPKAYWLFLLVLTIPFDIGKRTTTWLADPAGLAREFGLSGTLSIDFYLTDIVLFVMIVPWVAGLCLRRDSFYFPKVGFIFVLYLAYALISSLATATSFYLSIFEWCRQLLYFLSFLYLVNNVTTRLQLRAIVLGLIVGLVIETATVISFFDLGIGTDTQALSGLYREREDARPWAPSVHYEAESGSASQTKRSAGTFVHPALAAYYFESTLFVVLALLLTAYRLREQIIFGGLFAAGCIALYLTFSRSGLAGFLGGAFIFFGVAAWSGLISRRSFMRIALVFAMAAAVATPLVVQSLLARPKAAEMRLDLIERGLKAVWQRPIFGAGLNNNSAVVEGSMKMIKTPQGAELEASTIHNHYLIMLIDMGAVGFLLFFTFFWRIFAIGLRSMRNAAPETKVIMVGVIGSMASIAIHNLGDGFGGHSAIAMFWIFVGLIIALCRRAQAEETRPAPDAERSSLSVPELLFRR